MKLLNQNGKYRIISEFEIVEKLPANYFQLDWDDLGNIFLTESNKLMLPEKIYDFSSQNRKLIINSFLMGNKNMGVLLSGEKGTGKSIDAKLFCEEIDAPKILITKPIPKKIDFVQFLNNIKQSYVLFVDEFEKSFKINEFEDEEQSVHEQNSFLQLLDGLNNEFKKFFLFAANLRVSEYLINRPSRIKYLIRYKGIKEENAIFVINELLHDKSLTEDLLKNLDLHSLTIDIAPIHIKTENYVFDDGIDWTGITDKNLIIAICSISNLVCIHKIVSKKKITHMINVYHKLNLSNEMIEKAIEICDKRAVITGVTPTHVYQTNSTSVRNLLDSYDILMEAQSSEVTDMFGDE